MKLALLFSLFFSFAHACPGSGQLSFAERNDPVILTTERMEALVEKVREVYGPILRAEKNLELEIRTHWDSPIKNAFARLTTNAVVEIYGGLGKAKYMSEDHFLLLLCHEIGHHLGGEPRMKGENYWSSMEPQADYFAGKECMKKVLAEETLVAAVAEQVQKICEDQYPIESEYATCTRTAAAAELFGKRDFLATHMESEPQAYQLRPISLLTPWGDTPDLAYRFSNYPSSQCRADTFFQGALCNQTECLEGTGMKPRCWTSVERF